MKSLRKSRISRWRLVSGSMRALYQTKSESQRCRPARYLWPDGLSNVRVATTRAVRRAWTRAQPPGWTVRVIQRTAEDADASALAAMDDATAVSAALGGNRAAFDVIVKRHQRQVYQLCYRFVGNHEDASDLAQDVFLRAYRGLGKFRGGSSLATWLYRIGVNLCLNRAARKVSPTEPIDERRHI